MKKQIYFAGLACALASLLFILSGCGSSGGSTGEIFVEDFNSELMSVAGKWSFEALNENSATLTGCSGDLSGMEGMSYAQFRAAGPSCTEPGPPVASQNGDTFHLSQVAFNCEGEVRTLEGAGTVTGDQLTGNIDTSSAAGWMLREPISGNVTGGGASVSQTDVSYAQGLTGSCSVSPALNYAVTISVPDSPGAGGNLIGTQREIRGFH